MQTQQDSHLRAPVLVVAAMGFELKPLARRLGKVRHINRGELQARRAILRGRPIVMFRTGLGRKVAVENVKKALQEFQPVSVLFIGLAGSLRPDFRVGDPFVISSSALWTSDSENLSIDHALSLSLTYENTDRPIVHRIKGGRRVRRARLLTVDTFVNNVREKRRLGTAGYDIVDMEFGAIASALSGTGVPLHGLMTISDTLLQNFPDFKPSGEGMQGDPPPRLMVNSLRACRILGGFAHSWLKASVDELESNEQDAADE